MDKLLKARRELEKLELAGQIRILRSGMKLSQLEFGKIFGVSRNAVVDWETGRYRPRKEIRNKLKEMI